MTISYAAGFRFDSRLGMGEPVNMDEVSKPKEKPKPVKEDLSRYSDSTVEMVIVQWRDRKCLGKL